MRKCDYPSEICGYCACTDFGFASVNTGSYNLCEGRGCLEAYADWKEANPDDSREFEELF